MKECIVHFVQREVAPERAFLIMENGQICRVHLDYGDLMQGGNFALERSEFRIEA